MPYGARVVNYFALPVEDQRFFGSPSPAPGTRVSFEPDKLFAARERRGSKLERKLSADDGLVVNEDARGVILWPASLWRVDHLERPVRLEPGNRWVRVLAFTAIEQVPTWLVAGPHGDAVEWVINLARALTAEQVDALAAMPEDPEEPLRAALWKCWAQTRRVSGSPVGCSLSTLYDAIQEAARAVSPSLFSWSEEDGGEVLTDPAWQKAGRAASAAALGLGAPELLFAEQATALTHRWSSVFDLPDRPGHRGS